MKDRVIYLDAIRVVACIMVVIMHAPMPSEISENYGPFLAMSGYLTAPSVPLFFMVSGALLLSKRNQLSAVDYLKVRMHKVFIPILVFSVVYAIADYFIEGKDGKTLVKAIISIPFTGKGVLWFMYALVGLYLMVPVLSAWLEKATKNDLRLYLILWSISLCYPFIGVIVNVNESHEGILYYFSGYIGYFVLGYYVSKYDFSVIFLFTVSLLMFPLPVLNKFLEWNFSFYHAFWYLSITVAIMVATWFVGIKRILETRIQLTGVLRTIVIRISNLSFGIYLTHTLIMRRFLWHCSFIKNISNYYLQTLAIVVLTFVLAYLVSDALARIPYLNRIIGFSSVKKK